MAAPLAERKARASRVGEVFIGDGRFLAAHLMGDGGVFHGPEAHLAPVGDDHFVNEEGFDGGGGEELGAELFDEVVEAVAGFAFEEDGAGEEAVGDAVAGGFAFTGGGARAAGFGSVDTGGFGLFVSWHES